jgi:hypothetical protein
MMIHHYKSHVGNGGFAPATPGFNAVAPEWLFVYGATEAAPAIPAAESTLGSHPCVALSSAQVLPEWINRNLAGNAFAANGDNLLNFVSHARGSLQSRDRHRKTGWPGNGHRHRNGRCADRERSRWARLVTKIPSGLSAKEMERFLRENGAQLCGSRPAQSPRGPGDGGVRPIGATGLNPGGTPSKAPEITVELS